MQKIQKLGLNNGITYQLFTRNLSGGRFFYIRFFDKEGSLFLTRTASTKIKLEAHQRAAVILAMEDLEALALQKKARKEADSVGKDEKEKALSQALKPEAWKISEMKVVDALRHFWDPDKSPYLLDLKDAGRPLSSHYTGENRKNVDRYISKYEPFKTIQIREISFASVDDFLRKLRHQGKSRHVINSVINTLRAPCTWLSARGTMQAISFKGITLPAKKSKERGILTNEEIDKILALPTPPIWYTEQNKPRIDTKPRSRLPGESKNEGPAPVGFREKFFVILAAYTGARVGEARALRWRDVDIKTGQIHINWNYVDADGIKEPKARSRRTVVISSALEPLLLEARRIAHEIGADEPDHFILVNPSDFSKPISTTIIKKGWDRILRAIGISKEAQKRRNLVVHGLRHLYATKLIDAGMTPAEAGKLTGHRVLATLGRYSDHIQDSTLKQAKKILDKTLKGSK